MKKIDYSNAKPTLPGMLTFLTVGLGTLFGALALANRIYLINHYGWDRFTAESLHFVQTSKGHPWIVSNGDQLQVAFAHFLLTGALWVPLFLVVFLLLLKLFGRHLFVPDNDKA